jgi:GNAT superfamily N-acetyltransferase
MAALDIRVAEPSDRDAIVAVLTLAFAVDPPTRYIWPAAKTYLDHFPAFVSAFAGEAFGAGRAFAAADGSGASLWLAPGQSNDIQSVNRLFDRTVQEDRKTEAYAVFAKMAGYHPAEPHWYLPLIGADPAASGRGVGAALLKAGLDLADQEGRPTYLENSNPANRAFYERFGFESLGAIEVGHYPPLYPMVRPGGGA